MSLLPKHLQINAYARDADNSSLFDPTAEGRLLSKSFALGDVLAAPIPIDPRAWTDSRVGWGILLPDDPTLAAAAKADGADMPVCLRDLVAKRQGVILRYRPEAPWGSLCRYYPDGTIQDIQVAAQAWGTGRGKVPRYLLMVGSPAVLSWDLQFLLQADCFVGRIDLAGAALERYVGRLLHDWSGNGSSPQQPLVWATSQPGDITKLMRDSIASPLFNLFKSDKDLRPTFIDGSSSPATGSALIGALQASRPAFVATTSHGMTGPISDLPRMKADLGILVDAGLKMVSPEAMLAGWQPDGVIWYAHACCSAGSRSRTAFDGLVVPGSGVDRILKAIAGCGDIVAPFPQALLSAVKPAKAFVGHVEPTFDWSVRQNQTGQFLTHPLLDTFYQRLFSGEPIGMALDSCRRMASGLLNASYGTEVRAAGEGQSRSGEILALQLMANDWRAFVLLGDPACRVF